MDNELKHYGVLGMKWGIHRARNKAAKKQYKRRTDRAFKEYEKTIADIEKPYKKGQTLSKKDLDRQAAAEKKYKDAEAKAKADYKNAKKDRSKDVEIANKLYPNQSKKANEMIAQMSAGRAAAQSFMLGSYGALKYNEARAAGASKGKAIVNGILSNAANNITYGSLAANQYADNAFSRKK